LSAHPRKILIKAAGVELAAELLDTPTADRIWATLPIHATAHTWGAEVHFETHVETGWDADAREVVTLGEIGFSPEHDTITIGFGPTPISQENEIRLEGPANIWARCIDDARALAKVKAGQLIEVLRTS